MALVLGDNFSYGGSKPLDARLKYSTTTEMKAVADATMYDGCLAYCSGTDKTYQWKSTNTVDADTGRWREFSSGGGGGTSDYSDLTNKPSIEGVTLSGNKTASNLGLASSADMEKAYKSDDTSFTALADADYVPVYDTSASAKKKSTWSNIKSVLKTYFDTLYAVAYTMGTGLKNTSGTLSIKEFASGDMDEVIPELPSVGARYHKYSTDEQVVGEWIDGSIVYEKTLAITIPTTSTDGTQVTSAVSIESSVSKFISIVGYFSLSSNAYLMLPMRTAVSNYYGCSVLGCSASYTTSSERNTIKVQNSYKSYNGCVGYVTIQYTKTT